MSDGGSNYSKLCEEVGNCQFKWKPGANDRWNPMPFFIRMQEAARLLKSKFVIMLEPDNEVRGAIRADPPFAAGGLNDYTNRPFTREMMDYVESMGRACTGNASFAMKWDHFGLAGGSYFSAAAILDAFDPDTVDWRMLFHLDGKHMFSSDVAMPLALAVHGYTYYPWEEITQTRFGLQDKAAFRHYGRDELKPHYGEAPRRGVAPRHERGPGSEGPELPGLRVDPLRRRVPEDPAGRVPDHANGGTPGLVEAREQNPPLTGGA
eukprot:CAMPEP_0179303488 /NCGR_PEP_ID=MMETSP0797-20121207/48604_1 /TAXON_ID=47934 /ORGANISM="Dinophysis acuminata, Strain DAEP01" /LENGTH=263 /DNA_ID=CAMNT_0021013047 /DNA_START=47 /DNA_END=835 /DNA_ORIENTATION=-